jgi:hypothetical protein
MNTRIVRALLLVIAIAIISAATYLVKQSDATLVADRAAEDELREQARTLAGSIADMRTAQVAYVAQGQGAEFWMGHVAKRLPALLHQMTDFGSKLTAPVSQAAFEPAMVALENFQKLDARARDFVRTGNGLLAADLIFSDGLETTTNATTQIDVALTEELQARQLAQRDQQRKQLAILGGSAGGVLLVMSLLTFTGSRTTSKPLVVAAEPVVEPAEPPQPAVELKPTTPNLLSAAQVCTDLARVLESKQLPKLLERTAGVLEASGIIIWVADLAGSRLNAAMSFGYSNQVMARMGSIHRDANNAAASAYRTGEMRIVNGDTFANGALVMPLLTTDGCIGVLSAEMKGGSEKDESSQALAAIFAAQLAMLVSPSIAAATPQAAAQA